MTTAVPAPRLRPLARADGFILACVLDDPAAMQLAGLPFAGSLRDAEDFVERRLREAGSAFVVEWQGMACGYAGFRPLLAHAGHEIAFALGRLHRGQGLGAALVTQMQRHARTAFADASLLARCRISNAAAHATLARCAFTGLPPVSFGPDALAWRWPGS